MRTRPAQWLRGRRNTHAVALLYSGVAFLKIAKISPARSVFMCFADAGKIGCRSIYSGGGGVMGFDHQACGHHINLLGPDRPRINPSISAVSVGLISSFDDVISAFMCYTSHTEIVAPAIEEMVAHARICTRCIA
jgi:hypothetical protein